MTDDAKPPLKPANENSWYLLATLYGEQDALQFDSQLAERNRDAWNSWIMSALEQELRAKFPDSFFNDRKLTRLSFDDETTLPNRFALRAKADMALPRQKSPVDFENILFSRSVDFSGFIFPRKANLDGAVFSRNAGFERAVFIGDANFSKSAFLGVANFLYATFFSDAKFREAAFSREANFQRAEFSRRAFF